MQLLVEVKLKRHEAGSKPVLYTVVSRDKFVFTGLRGANGLQQLPRLQNCEGLAQTPTILPTIRLNGDEVEAKSIWLATPIQF